MWTCTLCKTSNPDKYNFCTGCGAPKKLPSDNHCSNPMCSAYKVILPNPTQEYCGVCGKPTIFRKKIDDLT